MVFIVSDNLKVVLIEPEISGNVGAVARSMKNFGFEELVIVGGCDIDQEARNRAKHANDILNNAEYLDEMGWDQFDLVVGTSAHTGGRDNIIRNSYTPEVLHEKISKINGRIAIVFGPEGKGLNNRQIERCDMLCSVPTSDEYPVMNLSHSVAVVLYALSCKESDGTDYEIAGRDLKQVLRNELHKIIDRIEVREYRIDMIQKSLKNMVERSLLSKREANTLIGFFKKARRELER